MITDKTTGIMIPDPPTSASADTFADLVNAVINNANIMKAMFTITGNLSSIQSDFNTGWFKDANGIIHAFGHPTPVKMLADGMPVSGTIVFETPFPTLCLNVIGSDAGTGAMAFGFYNLTKTGCSWRTCAGLGQAGGTYAPNYQAIGK